MTRSGFECCCRIALLSLFRSFLSTRRWICRRGLFLEALVGQAPHRNCHPGLNACARTRSPRVDRRYSCLFELRGRRAASWRRKRTTVEDCRRARSTRKTHCGKHETIAASFAQRPANNRFKSLQAPAVGGTSGSKALTTTEPAAPTRQFGGDEARTNCAIRSALALSTAGYAGGRSSSPGPAAFTFTRQMHGKTHPDIQSPLS
jgi:hypothetical protein